MATPEDDDDATVKKTYGAGLPSLGPGGEPRVRASDSQELAQATWAAKERYQRLEQLGVGGMGVVDLCHDARIGRDVAMKVMRPEAASFEDARLRFFKEARVQGQLEHPSIVPVYDVALAEGGAAYFTMKCLRGRTLAEVMKGLRKGDAAVAAAYSRRKLLNAFSSLCLAVDYAHSRGVLHRDLKPANVMLGSYGEVYVLDWGVAKVMESSDAAIDMRGAPIGEATVPGDMLGTPGYISPEQAWGKTDVVDVRSDVYSLGCILFELLTLETLHPRTDVFTALQSTTRGADARASLRAPHRDIPPELDAICVKATMTKPAERTASARALHDAIERFLDGDRNMELRRDLAAEHAARAERAMETALGSGADAEEARRTALHDVGRALALDPSNERGARVLRRVFTEPPRELPAEVAEELEASAGERHKFQLREGVFSDLAGILCVLPFVLWMGIQSWSVLWGLFGFTLASTVLKLLAERRIRTASAGTYAWLAFLANLFAVLCTARAFGPLLFMPLLLAMFTHGYSTTAWARYRAAVLTAAIVAQGAAVAVEISGVLPRSYEFANGALTILPRAVTLSEGPTLAALTMFAVFMLVVPVRMMGRLQSVLQDAERRAFVQAWQLRQLLPLGVKTAAG